MTFKANEIEQYPYLVYTDDAGNVYDPNGGGGGGEVTDASCIKAHFFAGDIELEKDPVTDYYSINGDHFISTIYAMPTDNLNPENPYIFVDGSNGYTYGMPVQWICNMIYGGYKESDPEDEIEFDGNETITAYIADIASGEKQAIELACTYGEYDDDPAYYFTIPPVANYKTGFLCISIDFGS